MSVTDTNEQAIQLPKADVPRKGKKDGADAKAVTAQAGATAPIQHFLVLGYAGKKFYFYHHKRQAILDFSANELTSSVLMTLAPKPWWEEQFPAKNGYDRELAVNALAEKAAKRGIFNPDRIRKRGAWNDAGRSVVHLGDRLLVDGKAMELGGIKSSFIYEGCERMADISESAATAEEGQAVLAVARMFRWERAINADILCGWAFLSNICGALKWRPHIWVTGGPGSGKSTIMSDFLRSISPEGWALMANGDSTEAGLRQALQSESRPTIMDEAESDNQRAKSRIDPVISLARQSSSDTAAKTYRGTVGGRSQSFSLRTMVALASIGVTDLKQQDVERIEVLRLLPKTTKGGLPWSEVKPHLEALMLNDGLADRLLRRAVDMMPVINKTIELFARVGAAKLGSQRNGDQIGALMAGVWCLTHDAEPTSEEVHAVFGDFDMEERQSEQEDEDAGLIAAISSVLIPVGGGINKTVGELIEAVIEERTLADATASNVRDMISGSNAAHLLAQYGMKAARYPAAVTFHPKNAHLLKMLENSHYATGLKDRLKRIEGAGVTGNLKLAGVQGRGVTIPLAYFYSKPE